MDSLSDSDDNQLTRLSDIMDEFNLWKYIDKTGSTSQHDKHNEAVNLLDDLKHETDRPVRIISSLSKLSSVGVSVEEKITLLQKLLTLDKLTELQVIRMLSEERGDLVSCLVRIINIYTDTAASNKDMLLKLMLMFHNKCLGEYCKHYTLYMHQSLINLTV